MQENIINNKKKYLKYKKKYLDFKLFGGVPAFRSTTIQMLPISRIRDYNSAEIILSEYDLEDYHDNHENNILNDQINDKINNASSITFSFKPVNRKFKKYQQENIFNNIINKHGKLIKKLTINNDYFPFTIDDMQFTNLQELYSNGQIYFNENVKFSKLTVLIYKNMDTSMEHYNYDYINDLNFQKLRTVRLGTVNASIVFKLNHNTITNLELTIDPTLSRNHGYPDFDQSVTFGNLNNLENLSIYSDFDIELNNITFNQLSKLIKLSIVSEKISNLNIYNLLNLKELVFDSRLDINSSLKSRSLTKLFMRIYKYNGNFFNFKINLPKLETLILYTDIDIILTKDNFYNKFLNVNKFKFRGAKFKLDNELIDLLKSKHFNIDNIETEFESEFESERYIKNNNIYKENI